MVENKRDDGDDDVVVATLLHAVADRLTKERRPFPLFNEDAANAFADDTKRPVAMITFQTDFLLGELLVFKEGMLVVVGVVVVTCDLGNVQGSIALIPTKILHKGAMIIIRYISLCKTFSPCVLNQQRRNDPKGRRTERPRLKHHPSIFHEDG